MFAGKTLLQVLSMGGFTMYILLFCSVLSLGVIIDRLVSYWKLGRIPRDRFMGSIKDKLKAKDF